MWRRHGNENPIFYQDRYDNPKLRLARSKRSTLLFSRFFFSFRLCNSGAFVLLMFARECEGMPNSLGSDGRSSCPHRHDEPWRSRSRALSIFLTVSPPLSRFRLPLGEDRVSPPSYVARPTTRCRWAEQGMKVRLARRDQLVNYTLKAV